MRAKSAGCLTRSIAALLALAFAAGILLRLYVPLWVCAAVAVLGALVCTRVIQDKPRSTLGILAAVFFLGSWRYDVAVRAPTSDISRLISFVSAVQGAVASDPQTTGAHTSFVLLVERAKTFTGWVHATGRVMVNLYADCDSAYMRHFAVGAKLAGTTLEYGDKIIMRARLYAPSPPTNPFGFSWKNYLSRKGIYTCASISHREQIQNLREQGGNALVRLVLRGRRALVDAIHRVYPSPENSVIAGMILGTYAYLPTDVLRDFCRTGTLHLLAASGYNCWILVFLLNPLLRWIKILPKWRWVAIIAALIFYVLAVGGKPSLVRAAVMASLGLLARFLKRAPDAKNLFFVAATVILAIEPSDLFDIGFQLSFLAVWGIINISPMLGAVKMLRSAGIVGLNAPRGRKSTSLLVRKILAGLGATAIATVSVMLVTAPVIAYYFNYVSLVALPANLAVELTVPLVFGAGLLSPVATEVLSYAGTAVTRIMLQVVSYLADLRFSALSVPSPPVLAIGGYYLLLYSVLCWLKLKVGRDGTNK